MTRQDELNEAWCSYMGKCSTEIIQALSFALRWCDEHPHWISVEDELPKENDWIIVSTFFNSVACPAYYYEGEDVEELRSQGITHWMPLPQMPKKVR